VNRQRVAYEWFGWARNPKDDRRAREHAVILPEKERTACGLRVPADHSVFAWSFNYHGGFDRCARCERAVAARS
jgi:hypothetical protein